MAREIAAPNGPVPGQAYLPCCAATIMPPCEQYLVAPDSLEPTVQSPFPGRTLVGAHLAYFYIVPALTM